MSEKPLLLPSATRAAPSSTLAAPAAVTTTTNSTVVDAGEKRFEKLKRKAEEARRELDEESKRQHLAALVAFCARPSAELTIVEAINKQLSVCRVELHAEALRAVRNKYHADVCTVYFEITFLTMRPLGEFYLRVVRDWLTEPPRDFLEFTSGMPLPTGGAVVDRKILGRACPHCMYTCHHTFDANELPFDQATNAVMHENSAMLVHALFTRAIEIVYAYAHTAVAFRVDSHAPDASDYNALIAGVFRRVEQSHIHHHAGTK